MATRYSVGAASSNINRIAVQSPCAITTHLVSAGTTSKLIHTMQHSGHMPVVTVPVRDNDPLLMHHDAGACVVRTFDQTMLNRVPTSLKVGNDQEFVFCCTC